jgi:hypothetical protein
MLRMTVKMQLFPQLCERSYELRAALESVL